MYINGKAYYSMDYFGEKGSLQRNGMAAIPKIQTITNASSLLIYTKDLNLTMIK